LNKGKSFDQFATENTEDQASQQRSGYLGFFGIGRYETGFEDAAFALAKDGDMSAPYESSIGWHIILRKSKKGIEPFDAVKSRLKARIQRDTRYELARTAMVERIKGEAQFTEGAAAREKYIATLDSTFLTYAFKVPENLSNDKLLSFGGTTTTISEWATWLNESANKRINYAMQMNNKVPDIAQKLYGEFVIDKALAYEETQLDKKYPDFKNLMREYEEGILLFEAIKQNVWDKASQDTVGLERFFSKNENKYTWDERASLIYYTISDSAKADSMKIRKFAEKNAPQAVLKKFNKKGEAVKFREETLERNKIKNVAPSVLKAGTVVVPNAADGLNFVKVEKIMPKMPKALKDARGYVVADYQEFLEKEWMTELTAKYKVNVDKDVLKSIIKK
jgi:peptidyl-prolyl cis-trans isomerase SurA